MSNEERLREAIRILHPDVPEKEREEMLKHILSQKKEIQNVKQV